MERLMFKMDLLHILNGTKWLKEALNVLLLYWQNEDRLGILRWIILLELFAKFLWTFLTQKESNQ